MPSFRYEAVAATGDVITGNMEAATRDEMVTRLQRMGHIPIRAEAGDPGAAVPTGQRLRFRWRRPPIRDLARTTQQLAVLLQAGLSVDRALEIAASTSSDAVEARCLAAALERVRGGASLADAMAADSAFPKFFVGMVRAGEAGATLDATLRDLASLLERGATAREQMKSALIYPALVLATCAGSVGMFFFFVIPRFRPIFEQAGAKLPFVASVVLAIADFGQTWWWAALAALAVLALALERMLRNPQGRQWWDRRLIALPLIGDIVTKIEIGRFANTLGTLLRNGVPPVAALAVTREAVGNAVIGDALAAISQSLKEGGGLAGPIAESGVFPGLAVQLIRVGEETAHLEAMLIKIGEIYAAEAQRSTERLLALLVPSITIALGVVVAVVIGSIFTAVLSVYEFAV